MTTAWPPPALAAITGAWIFGALAGGGCTPEPDTTVESVIDASWQPGDPDGRPGIDGRGGGIAEKIVFATSSTQNGDLAGLSGADGICGDLAEAAGLAGTFKAWLSSSGQPAEDRLSHAGVPYVRTDGTRVADDWNDLVDGNLAAPINSDQDGAPISGDVWTGTRPNGSTADATCGDFDSSEGFGVCGSSTETGGSWSDNIQPFCTSALRLYCVEQ